jgi:hypothetical protein
VCVVGLLLLLLHTTWEFENLLVNNDEYLGEQHSSCADEVNISKSSGSLD